MRDESKMKIIEQIENKKYHEVRMEEYMNTLIIPSIIENIYIYIYIYIYIKYIIHSKSNSDNIILYHYTFNFQMIFSVVPFIMHIAFQF